MADTSASSRRLPTVLQQPQSRSVQILLESRLPARVAWVDRHGRPQVAPMWFEWIDDSLLMSAFVGSRKLEDLTDGTNLAVTIDTADFPYRSVKMWGQITVEPSTGLTESYRRASRRVLGETAGNQWCESLANKDQVLIRLHPVRASESDMSAMPFMIEPTEGE